MGFLNTRKVNTETIVEDLRTLAEDAEELVKVASNNLTDKSRDAANAALKQFKSSCKTAEQKARQGVVAADELVRENPYWSAGAAFGIGLLIGVLVNRGSRDD